MSDKTSIEWTATVNADGTVTPGGTWNPTRGCTKIAPGCAHCYAETFAERFRGVPGHPYERGFDPRLAPEKLTEPLKWKKPRRIFVDSMSDLFHEAFPFEYIAACFGVMAASPQHTFQILTKRPERAVEFFSWIAEQSEDLRASVGEEPPSGHAEPSACALMLAQVSGVDRLTAVQKATWPMRNVWIGTSIANQTDADKNIPHLLQIPAAIRFLSVEPLIEPVNIGTWIRLHHDVYGDGPFRSTYAPAGVYRADFNRHRACSVTATNGHLLGVKPSEFEHIPLDWLIVGGESGPGARPCNVEWIRSIVVQCKEAGVPVFVKQLGANVTIPNSERWPQEWPNSPEIGMSRTAHVDPDRIRLRDRKGGDWNEWPSDLRIREFPTEATP